MTMNKNADRSLILDSMPVKQALIRLAVPSILASMVTTIYNIADTFFIGQLHNTVMIAATTVAMPIMMLTHAFGESIGVSAGSYISRQLGAGQRDQVSRIVQTTMTLVVLISIVLPILFITFLGPLLGMFGAEGDVTMYAAQYVTILLVFAFSQIIKLTIVHLLRAEGDVNFPMAAIFAGVVANLILDPIFMFDWGLNLGIAGAAWATAAAQCLSLVMLLGRLLFKAEAVRWNPRVWMLDKAAVQEILSLGVAVFARQALPSVTYSCLAMQASVYGTDFLAGIGIAKKCLNLVMFAIIGFAQGFQPFAAYNYGAGNRPRLKQALKSALTWVTVYGCFAAVFYITLAPQIVQIFSREAAVIEMGRMMLYGYAVSMPVVGAYNIAAVLLQALGEKRSAFFLSIARQGLFYIPIIWILPSLLGKLGIFMAQPCADYLTILTVIFLCRHLFVDLMKG